MAEVITAPAAVKAATTMYRPSWVDRLVDWIDARPGPAWVPYAIAFFGVAAAANAAAWADGYVALGTFDPYVNSLAFYFIGGFAAIHYLDAAAQRAWARFRPALLLSDEEAGQVAYELTTMPARPTLVWSFVGIVGAALYGATQYGAPLDFAEEPLTLTFVTAVALPSFAGAAALIYHSIRQLRLIGHLRRYLDTVDLLHLEPLHAFAGVTAATGMFLLALSYLSALTDPATFSNPALFAFTIGSVGLAVASFVVPLYGIHTQIAAEKSRRLAAVNGRLDGALRDLDRRADEHDLSEADAVNKHLSSLLAERDVLTRTPTWPWAPETLRGFGTALVLPVVLWLAFRLLERVLE